MTLMFGTVTGLLLGLVLGRSRLSIALAAVAWYAFLALQTAYLAEPGATGFGGADGSDALQGGLYWLAQPVIFGVIIALLLISARLHDKVSHARARGTAGAGTEAAGGEATPPAYPGRGSSWTRWTTPWSGSRS